MLLWENNQTLGGVMWRDTMHSYLTPPEADYVSVISQSLLVVF